MRLPSFVGPSATASDFNADCELTVNWFTEKLDPSGDGKTAAKVLLPKLHTKSRRLFTTKS